MCTLIVLNEVVPDYPLVVAANRDERYDRKSSPPEVETAADGWSHVCPLDGEKGGTWMGVDQNGWFVGITNQDDGHHNEHAPSRGLIVHRALLTRGHRGTARLLASLDPVDYNPFNLVFGRPRAMFLSRVLPGQHIEMDPLPKGINVISNDCWGNRYTGKTSHAAELAAAMLAKGTDIAWVRDGMLAVLGNHAAPPDDPFQALCVHADEYSFGTRSSSLITVSNQGVVEYWFKEGPTCRPGEPTLAGRLLHLDLSDLK